MAHRPPSTVHRPPSTVHRPPPTAHRMRTFYLITLLFCTLTTSQAQPQLVETPMGVPASIQSFNDTLLFARYQKYQETYIFRSTDFGRHWTAMPDSVSRYSNPSPYTLVDGRLYNGGGSKQRYSTDLGQTWQNFEHPATENNYDYFRAFWRDTVLFAENARVIRALPAGGRDTVWQGPNGSNIWAFHRYQDRFFIWTADGLYYSDDVGQHWTTSNLAGFPSPDYTHRLLPSGNRLFAWGYYPDSSRLYQSNDWGATWASAGNFANHGNYTYWDIFRSNKALFMTENYFTIFGDSIRMYRLADDDANWQLYQNFFKADKPVIESDSVLLLTNPYALVRSIDGGASWQAAPADGGQINAAQYFVWPQGAAVAVDGFHGYARPDLLHPYQWLSLLDNSASCSDQWAQYGDSVVMGCGWKWQFSFDRGQIWTSILDVPDTYYFNRLFWDKDGLWGWIQKADSVHSYFAHWSFSNQAWEDLRPVPNLSVSLVKQGHSLFLNTAGTNKILVSTNLGLNWQEINHVFPVDANFYKAEAVGNGVFIYSNLNLTTKQYQFVSTDKGITWQVPKTEYGTPVLGFGEMEGAGDNLFAAVDIGGIFMEYRFSDDAGLTWYYLPDSAIGSQMRIFSDDSLLYFSRGNHIFRNRISWYRSQHAQVQVFSDLNGNGQRDAGEPPFEGGIVYGHIGQGISDSTGFARLRVANFDDTLRIFPAHAGFSAFPPFHAVTESDTTYVFGIHAAHNADLAAALNGHGPVRPGFSSNYSLSLHNWGNLPQNAVLKTVFDPAIDFVQADPAPTQVLGDTLCWQLGNLAPFAQQGVTIQLHLPSNVSIGTALQHQAWVYADSLDGNPIDNRDTLTEIVVGSFDPNDKQVQPSGNLSPASLAQGQEMTYKIRFQNTGNYQAENVLVLDTIRPELDLRSFQFLNASHPCTVKFREPNVVVFSFVQINLPDSASNQAGSHGFILYSIRPKTNLPLGTQIHNTAQIYFDFNAPIFTNTVETIVAEDSVVNATDHIMRKGFQVQVAPNPFSTNFWVELDTPQTSTMSVRFLDASGRLLMIKNCPILQPGITRIQIPVEDQPAGFYWLECRLGNEVQRVKLIRK